MTPRYRRSSVRAVVETLTQDQSAAARAHDVLWATLWNRRHEDVAEPVWLPDAVYAGILAFAHRFPEGTALAGVDIGEAFVVFRDLRDAPPIGSRVRVLPADRERWRFGEGTQSLGLGLELRFDDGGAPGDAGWVERLRAGIGLVRGALAARRGQLAARRAQLGALNEPAPVEAIWRHEVAAISERVTRETEYTADEHAAMARARAKGPRQRDEVEQRLVAARRQRFNERGSAEVAAFRAERWPAVRDAALAEIARYAAYRDEVIRLEDALQRVRSLHGRVDEALRMLDTIDGAGFRVAALTFDPARLNEPGYPEELLRTVELLHGSVPLRAQAVATSFSAYRAPTAGPSVIPPRL